VNEKRLFTIAVVTMIIVAAVFSGHAETSLEQQCLQRASANACRRI
jgi:hypothetical protein